MIPVHLWGAEAYYLEMKRISLLRHAEAADKSPSITDRERPLTPRGREDATLIGDFLAKSPHRPDVALCSPSVRTRETLEGVEARLSGPLEVMIDAAIYAASEEALLAAIQALPDGFAHVLVVGHNPEFHALALRLAGPGSNAGALRQLGNGFAKGALASFELDISAWAGAQFGAGRLTAFTRPADLRAQD